MLFETCHMLDHQCSRCNTLGVVVNINARFVPPLRQQRVSHRMKIRGPRKQDVSERAMEENSRGGSEIRRPHLRGPGAPYGHVRLEQTETTAKCSLWRPGAGRLNRRSNAPDSPAGWPFWLSHGGVVQATTSNPEVIKPAGRGDQPDRFSPHPGDCATRTAKHECRAMNPQGDRANGTTLSSQARSLEQRTEDL